jgi:hypothetical protein
MRKNTFFAVVAALVVIGVATWISVRIPTPLTGSPVYQSAMTGAKSPATAHYDDYSLVVY